MTAPPERTKHLRPDDLRGAARLATQAVLAVSDIAEGVHQSVWQTLGVSPPAPGRTGGLTGLVYRSVRGVTRGVGKGVDQALAALLPLLQTPEGDQAADSAPRAAVLAALNGVMGDRLAESGSPFTTAMSLYHVGTLIDPLAPALAAPSERVLLLVHGLCMNEAAWQAGQEPGAPPAYADSLAPTLGATVLGLRYNTGRHVAHNGRELAQLIERLVAHWPVPLRQLDVLAHSMGGLVIRSAVQAAQEAGLAWPRQLGHLVFLGTPHHGAPLERAGHGVDKLLAGSRFTAPFTRLARLRSAGITDLRHGRVRDEGGPAHDRFGSGADDRTPLPLPEGVACHTVAATTAGRRSPLADRLVGDGLVPLHSALGEHVDPHHRLAFAPASSHIAYRTGHLALLHSAEVGTHVLRWLGEVPAGQNGA
jgi:PGAP1-like protein